MNIILAFSLSFAILLFSVVRGIFAGFPLVICLIIFILLSMKRGYTFREVLIMAYDGGKKSFLILEIFILIGTITSIWISAGTVPSIVYYGIKYISSRMFILCTFLITCLVSFLIGTSFGTVSTVGIALMIMGTSGGASVPITAGAIISGAYFGDRCSPMSSSANLVASITNTNLYKNISNMVRTSVLPFIFTVLIYAIISIKSPLSNANASMVNEISTYFTINFLTLMPALIILVLSFFKIDVKKSMSISIILAVAISNIIQHRSMVSILKYAIFGFTMDNGSNLSKVMTGGGIISMVKVSFIVFISSTFAGIFENTDMLKSLENIILKAKSKRSVYFTTVLVSIIASAFGCTQVIAIMLTELLVKKIYLKNKIDNYKLASDIENTAVVIAPLIPWNIAVLVPLTSLNAPFISIFFCTYLYLLPILNIPGKK
ncbi:MAG: mleN [Clostridiaceae bacterium]|jgi:NhaC family Na+:H+ antiporter|nr:mleN [Clostridiaceae bacterium]